MDVGNENKIMAENTLPVTKCENYKRYGWMRKTWRSGKGDARNFVNGG